MDVCPACDHRPFLAYHQHFEPRRPTHMICNGAAMNDPGPATIGVGSHDLPRMWHDGCRTVIERARGRSRGRWRRPGLTTECRRHVPGGAVRWRGYVQRLAHVEAWAARARHGRSVACMPPANKGAADGDGGRHENHDCTRGVASPRFFFTDLDDSWMRPWHYPTPSFRWPLPGAAGLARFPHPWQGLSQPRD
jgi:hypothetical protein